MGFDRNTIIGFVLLGALFIGFFAYNNYHQQKYLVAKKRYDDSVATVQKRFNNVEQVRADSLRRQQMKDSSDAGSLVDNTRGVEQLSYIENSLMRVTLTNKGGWVKMVELKKFKGPDGTWVKMGGTPADLFDYNINTGNNQGISINKLFFNTPVINKAPDGTQTISYQIAVPDGRSVAHSFVVRPNDYLIDANIGLTGGAGQMLNGQSLSLTWQVQARQQQKDIEYERRQTQLVYYSNDSYDFNRATESTSESFSHPTRFIGIKQQFFNSTLLAKNGFNSAQASLTVPADTTKNELGILKTTASIQVPAGNVAVPLQLFYGPNDYKLLKSYDNGMYNIIDLGSGIYAFVKYINRWIILPIFNLLAGLVGFKMGWAILLLTVFIRLLTAPLTVPGYKNSAKMQLLQPELKALKEKYGDDQQGYSVAQMKFMSDAGASPLKGCLPGLLQIPIFFALFAFFNSNLMLRGHPFLWASDLSMYDSILNLPFKIPFYGDHVSLFTITACLTSFLISWYGMSNANIDQSNPMMKYMPYIFPFFMLFFFNSQPAALTWYYTVSNTVALLIQIFIKKFVIDHDKLMTQIAANRAKPKTKNKWQERIEAMQETQKKLQETQAKTKNR